MSVDIMTVADMEIEAWRLDDRLTGRQTGRQADRQTSMNDQGSDVIVRRAALDQHSTISSSTRERETTS
jgi:hypothetical protein